MIPTVMMKYGIVVKGTGTFFLPLKAGGFVATWQSVTHVLTSVAMLKKAAAIAGIAGIGTAEAYRKRKRKQL